MAVVVVQRPPARLYAGQRFGLRGLAVASAGACALSLVLESAARALPSTTWLDPLAITVASLSAVLTVGVGLGAWATRRSDAALLLAATLAPVLLALRTVATGVLVTLDLMTVAAAVSAPSGLLVLGATVWTASAWRIARVSRVGATPRLELFRRVAEITAFILFAVALSGAAVQAVGASWACRGVFPDCNGLGLLPFGRDPLADIQLYHRLLAYVALGLVLWLAVEAFRSQRG